MDEKEGRQDTARDVQDVVNMLKEYQVALLQRADPELMTPIECGNALVGCVNVLVRLLKLQWKLEQANPSTSEEEAALVAFFRAGGHSVQDLPSVCDEQ